MILSYPIWQVLLEVFLGLVIFAGLCVLCADDGDDNRPQPGDER